MFITQKTIVLNSEGKILALRRSDTDPSRPLTWDLPGGYLEEGEVLEESARREIREEAGIQVDDLRIFDAAAGQSQKGEYWVQICYVAHVDMPEIIISWEHDLYEWLTKEEFLARESSEKIVRFLQKLP
ncbi:MAG: NUDIX hydrolase [Patescibacteria group bacterium]